MKVCERNGEVKGSEAKPKKKERGKGGERR